MPPHPHVPEALRHGPFRGADAVKAGITGKQLRSSCWKHLFRDVYVWNGLPDTAELRLAALSLALPPDTVVHGRTAAWLHGVITPDPTRSLPLDVATSVRGSRMRQPGITAVERCLDPSDVTTHGTVPVTTPLRTCFDLMRSSTLTDAVVAADAYLHAGLFTQGALQRYVDEHPGYRNVRQARTATLLANPGSESPGETRLRLVIIMAGLPEPELNWPVHDQRGKFLGRPDMLYLDPLFGLEYDGAYHADPDVLAADYRRENRLLLGHVPLLRYTARDVGHRPGLIVDQVQAALAGRL